MSAQLPCFFPEPVIRRLGAFPGALRPLVAGLSHTDLIWRPSPDCWSITEILAHLALEEAQDFRPRIQRILAVPQLDWDPIDPEAAVQAADAHERGASHWLDAFEVERSDSVEWLNGIQSPDWSRANVHPVHGAMPASGMLCAWSAHDALHLRQIAKRLFEIAQRDGGRYEVGYAGSWQEKGDPSSPAP